MPAYPTAHALRADVAATPKSQPPPAGRGLGTRVHPVPFQPSIRVWPKPSTPTAQALRAEVAATPSRMLLPAGLGLGTRFHPVPFHRTIRVFSPPTIPTAQALRAEAAATPSNQLELGTAANAAGPADPDRAAPAAPAPARPDAASPTPAAPAHNTHLQPPLMPGRGIEITQVGGSRFIHRA